MTSNQFFAFDASAAAAATVAAAVAGKRIEVYGYTLINGVASAQTIVFKSNATSLSGVMALPSSVGGGIVCNRASDQDCLFRTNPGEALTVTLSAATQVAGHVAFKYVAA